MVARPPSTLPHGGGVAGVCRLVGEPGRQLAPASALLRRRTAASGPGGLWLQADGCCSKASWVAVETSAAGNIALARGWQTFARARGLGRRCTLHFEYNGDATLYVKVFGEGSRRVGCCPEDNDGDEVLGLGDGRDEGEGEPPPGGVRSSPSFSGSSSGESSSSGGSDQPPRRRARFEGGSGSSRRHASVKREEESD